MRNNQLRRIGGIPRVRLFGLLILAATVLGHGKALAQQPPAAAGRASQTPAIDYATAHTDRRLQAVRATERLSLDGRLDEPVWSQAPVATHFIQSDPREGQPATEDTEVRVVYDDDALFIGVFAKDREPSRILTNDLKKDYTTTGSDGFLIVLDTFHDGRNGFEFAVNPSGAKWDAQMTNEGREVNANWDGVWDVVTRETDAGWYAEFRIPFRTLKFDDADVHTWGVNFQRRIRRLNEDSYWSPLPRIYDLDRVSMAGTVEGMSGLRSGRNFRVKPYALASSNTLGGNGTTGDFQAGVDAKYGLTSGLTWDFTVNTDFSQVEADEQQVNLSRVSLFFPEKRDFFLENSGIFGFGGGGPFGGNGAFSGRPGSTQDMRLFFSRRIGLSDAGVAIPVLGGTRLTGRQGAYSIGLLNIQQREQGGVPATNFTAIRLQRDLFANSDVGVIFLDKEQSGPAFNRVGGVDANFRFGLVTANVYAAQTYSPAGTAPKTGNALATRAVLSYQSRQWQFAGRFDGFGERFNDEMGFVPRLGVNDTFLQVGRRFRPRALSKWLRETRPHWQVDQFTHQDGSGLDSRYQDFHWQLQFQDGSTAEIGINPNVEVVESRFLINAPRRVPIGPGRYEFNEYFGYWNTNTSARFSMSNRVGVGRFYDGYRHSYAFGPALRLNEHLNASLTLQVNNVSLPTGSFVSKLITSRINYNFNQKMFLNGLLQYNNDTRQWNSNIRFNIIHHPLSDFFIVYNEQHDERTQALISRAVIAKLTHMLAF